MATFSQKLMGKEVGAAAVYAKPHNMSGKSVTVESNPGKGEDMGLLNNARASLGSITCCFLGNCFRLCYKLFSTCFTCSLGLGCRGVLTRAETFNSRFRQVPLPRLTRRFTRLGAPFLVTPIFQGLLRSFHLKSSAVNSAVNSA